MAFVVPLLVGIGGAATAGVATGTAAAVIGGAVVGSTVAAGVSLASDQRKAQKKQANAVRDAAQDRSRAKVKSDELIARAEALPEKAKETAAIAAGKKRRRGTISTSPRGLLDEPAVSKPTLLG